MAPAADTGVDEADLVPLSALQHWLYCPRQCALIHVEQVWAENHATADGQVKHARVNQLGEEVRRGVRTVTGMPLRSFRLGVSGTADVVELHREGGGTGWRPYPVEHKRGRSKSHRADEVQLCAQAMALEEMFDTVIAEGALFYQTPRRRLVVTFDTNLRALTAETAAAVRACLAAGTTPGADYEAGRCDPCSLIELCRPKALGRARSPRAWLERMIED
ncbi:CRISPR-associated protein Cas4 [Caulobacter sp. LARHSG274]